MIPVMKIAVTGAAGRLGIYVCRTLTEAGHTVMATDLRLNRESGMRIEVANLLDREGCYRLVEGADVLVHLGNYPNVFSRPPAQIYSENMAMNANIFQAALEADVKKWIFSSSIQAMRGTRTITQNRPSSLAYLPVDGDAPVNPSNAYGLSKGAAEQMMQYYAAVENITAVALRYPMLLNLEEKPFEKKMFSQPYPFPDEAFAYLDFRDAANLVEAIIRSPMSGYKCYLPVAKENLMRRPGHDLIPEYYANVPLRKPLDQIDQLVDISAIERDTGWTPKYL
jgi:nucleoside-diphosphate-sugar epimerase